jgi:transcriptional regulator with XRE-family HTH domain
LALFFDQDWFDGRLKGAGKSHEDLALAMGLPLQELAAIWKDQRELSAADVSVMAQVLGVEEGEVVKRAGVSTPVPGGEATETQALARKISQLEDRIKALEHQVTVLQTLKSNP